MYVSERIVNIAELEEHIEKAYLISVVLQKEFYKDKRDIAKIQIYINDITEELHAAQGFEFHIERRKTI